MMLAFLNTSIWFKTNCQLKGNENKEKTDENAQRKSSELLWLLEIAAELDDLILNIAWKYLKLKCVLYRAIICYMLYIDFSLMPANVPSSVTRKRAA